MRDDPAGAEMTAAHELLGKKVAEVVVRMPKTLPSDTSVAAARAALTDDHVHMLLLTDDGRLIGTVVREDLPDEVCGSDPALAYAVLSERTVSAEASAEEARQLLLDRGQRRFAVVDDEGLLLGLLGLKRRQTGFCSDRDVAARTRP